MTERVRSFFDPELLNRFDEIVVFDSVERGTARTVVDREIDRIVATVADRGVDCAVTDDARETLLRLAFDIRYGVRALHRALRVHLVAPIAAVLADRDGDHPARLLVDAVGGAVVVTVVGGDTT